MSDDENFVTRRECDLIEGGVKGELKGIRAEVRGFRTDIVEELKQLNGSNSNNTQFRLTHKALHVQQQDITASFRTQLFLAVASLGVITTAVNVAIALVK